MESSKILFGFHSNITPLCLVSNLSKSWRPLLNQTNSPKTRMLALNSIHNSIKTGGIIDFKIYDLVQKLYDYNFPSVYFKFPEHIKGVHISEYKRK